jgi:pyruvate dehydrogenase E2 component (dihydrolipoamide acetyltransferase)
MATSVIMPALEMAQESGTLLSWLKHAGESVNKGEPLMAIETDKVTVEIEAPASGVLGGVTAGEGDVIPVGRTIAWILAPGEQPPAELLEMQASGRATSQPQPAPAASQASSNRSVEISPVARKIAEEHGIDAAAIRSDGRRIEKADVLAYIDATRTAGAPSNNAERLSPASPKARRLAEERGIPLASLHGSGPDGAVLAADVPLEANSSRGESQTESVGAVWRLMAERMSSSWTSVPHFYLVREVDASGLVEWRSRAAESVEKRSGAKLSYTDLLVKAIAHTLCEHPRLNASWLDGKIEYHEEINVGIATAIEEGLIVPVIRAADKASLSEIAAKRADLVERARSRKLGPADISSGTFTLSNLGMYHVDAFNAIINTPQAAILAVGQIAERVIPLNGQPVIRPGMVLTLSCDHRAVDGARGAQFLDDLASSIENPWRLLS